MSRALVIGLVVVVAIVAALRRSREPDHNHTDQAATALAAGASLGGGAAQLVAPAPAPAPAPALILTTLDEAAAVLPVLSGARTLSPPHTARGGWTVETELCIDGRDAAAVAGEIQRALTAQGFAGVTNEAAPDQDDHYRLRAHRDAAENEQWSAYAFAAARELPECDGAQGAIWVQLGIHKTTR